MASCGVLARRKSLCPLCCRYALPSAEATRHRRGENCHPKPDGPAEVSWLSLARPNALIDVEAAQDFNALFLQKGPRGGGVWGARGVRSGRAHQYRRGQGERRSAAGVKNKCIKKIHYNVLLSFWLLRPRMEVRGPPSTKETPTRCTASRWRHPGHSSARWKGASTRCLSPWGTTFFLPLDNQCETLSMPHIAACRRVNVSAPPRDSTGCVWIPEQLDFLSAVRSAVQLGWTAETPGRQGPSLRKKKILLDATCHRSYERPQTQWGGDVAL